MRPVQKHEEVWRQWETLRIERGACYEPVRHGETQWTSQEAYKWLRKAYGSDFVQEQVQRIYPESVHAFGQRYFDTHSHYPTEEMCALIAVGYAAWLARGNSPSDFTGLQLRELVKG